jgi:hypothetical protein
MVTTDHRTAPCVFCDHCQQRIQTAGDGNAEWEAVQKADILFTHKHCTDAFRVAHMQVTKSMELTYFPLRLTFNLDIDVNWAMESLTDLAKFH